MIRKLIVFPLLVLFLMFSLVPYIAQADHYKKGGRHHKDLDEKIYYKAKFMLKNQDELGLSDEQVNKIKDLKYATKREVIKRDAEIDLVKVDIKQKLHEDKTDVEGINTLIDKKYALKNEKAKYSVKTYADLKNILTEEQMKELKTLFREKTKTGKR